MDRNFSFIMDVEARIERRKEISNNLVSRFLDVEAEKRGKYFFNEVADHQEVWTVWDGEVLPEYETSIGKWAINCWPHRAFAREFHSKTIKDPQFVPIPIDAFIDDVIKPNIDTLELMIFPVAVNHTALCMEPNAFISRLLEEYNRIYGEVPKLYFNQSC